ncbi:hypothetical protein [Pseudomonas sp. BF-RE-29]|uniref:hypothetical protein n=1 Tax=Pseudomonas sp. BF-RE-29 TaxID=2832378 RepID=UPI001CBCE34F|nr:hypothetical protein [Pseudomonas sp. BF-RE-29]
MELREKLKALRPASSIFRDKLRELDELETKIYRPPNTQEAHDHGLHHNFYCEISDLIQDRRMLITKNYRRQIEGLSMPMPDPADPKLWEDVENGITQQSERCLTMAGEHAAISIIREARKYRRDAITAWCTALTGLGGAVIGVLSMLKVFG